MKRLLILLPVIFLFACSKQIPKGKSKAKVSILALNGGSFPGGAFIHGKKSTGESFNKRVQGADFDIELDNGEWTFTALVWDSGVPFEGVPQCDFKQNEELSGGEININFNVSSSECKFGPPTSHAGNVRTGNILPLKIHTCSDIVPHDPDNIDFNDMPSDCEGNIGKAKSFKIRLYEFDPTDNPWGNRGAGFQSGCLGDITESDGTIVLPINIPLFEQNQKFPFEIISFDNNGCDGSGGQSVFTFKQGNGNLEEDYRGFFFADGSHVNVLLQSDLCTGDWMDNSPFANGAVVASGDGENYICTVEQLKSMDSTDATILAADYILLKDLNLVGEGNNFSIGTITNPFTGSFEGRGHKLENYIRTAVVDDPDPDVHEKFAGFFGSIDGAYISDLVLKDFSVSVAATDGTYTLVGGLVGNISSGASNKTEIENINFENLIVVNNGTNSSNHTGGLVGHINLPAADHSTYIRHINVEGNITGYGSVGGVVGYNLSSNGDLSINRSSFNGSVTGDYNIGGIIGNCNGKGHLDNVFVGDSGVGNEVHLTGNANIGGIVGVNLDLSINSAVSYVDVALIGTPHSPGFIGGISGWSINSGMYNVNSNFDFTTSYIGSGETILESVGGLVGYSTGHTISNGYAEVSIVADGKSFGGIIGSAGAVALESTIENSIAYGEIATLSTSGTGNDTRGGIVGLLSGNIKDSVALVDINGGDDKLGGAVGEIGAGTSMISEVYIAGDVTHNHTFVTSGIGGALGYIGDAVVNQVTIFDIFSKSNVNHSVNGCTNCKNLIGTNDESDDSNFTIGELISGGVVSYLGSPQAFSAMNGNQTGVTNLAQEGVPCSGFNCVPNIWEEVNSKASLVFYNQWLDFGDLNNDNYPDVLGNSLDPFQIENCEDWNKISDNQFLLNKSFKLKNNLNLSNTSSGCSATVAGELVPFGGPLSSENIYPFKGSLFANEFKIIGPSLVTGSYTYNGLIRRLGDGSGARAQVGEWDDPLVVEGGTIVTNTGVSTIGMIAGSVTNGTIHAVVKDGTISGTGGGSYVGGIAGEIFEGEISKSSFQGSISVPGKISVGGLVGNILNYSNQSIRIERSSVNLSTLEGSNFVGGLIGYAGVISGSSSLNLRSNYVSFSPVSNPTIIGGTYKSGIIGKVINNGASYKENFVDLVNIGFSSTPSNTFINDESTGTPVYSNNFIIDGSSSGNTSLKSVVNHSELFTHLSELEDSWNWELKNNKVQFRVYEHED